MAARNRRELARQETAWKNRIHRHLEILFPGFLPTYQAQIVAFTEASLSLMEGDFPAIRVKRMSIRDSFGSIQGVRDAYESLRGA